MNNTIKGTWTNNTFVPLQDLTGMVFQYEDGAHSFEISGSDGTSAITLTGTVSCVFVRPDNADIAISGTITSGKAVVTLTDDCYYVPGRFFITIFLTNGTTKTAIYAGIGTVARTSGGAVAGDTPQDVADLIAEIDQYSALLDSVANGHGGIKSIAKTGSTGTNPVVDTYTLTYADDDTFQFTVTNGIQGVPGPAASVSSHSVQYQASNSYDMPPTGTWQPSPPSVSGGEYLWTKTSVTYSDNTTVISYSVARQGIDGAGSVSKVCNVSPDANGNVTLTASDVGALASAPVTSVNTETGAVVLDAADVGAVPSSGSDGFLYRSSDTVSQKELYKTLWDGGGTQSWESGELTVTGASNYTMFVLSLFGYDTKITAYKSDDGSVVQGMGGFPYSPSTDTNYYFAASISGDTWTLTYCRSRTNNGSANPRSIGKIVGVI